MQNFVRTILFVVFFSVGAGAIAASALYDDFVNHYRNKHYLDQARLLTQKLESLNEDYNAAIRRIEEDPNIIKRLAPAELGTENDDPNTVTPRATQEDLAEAKKALAKIVEAEPNEIPVPQWMERCREPKQRTYLFTAGAALILVSFAFFGILKETEEKI
ncbi:MAG: hypothetical protein ACYS8Z_10935 [Planctomycetota bacterium]